VKLIITAVYEPHLAVFQIMPAFLHLTANSTLPRFWKLVRTRKLATFTVVNYSWINLC